ncbi:hypothetical protein QBC32DRAFT_409097 [Pseudoneurospora amorphoporcata]|uniref:Uncharacterized protein n=1 Tax=Pseudoneurospora amorphoporcata TaxID=241081 RepID=A0AAN6SC94_9PEZI|nr:hypothetical protein QBC32DRAFT_409097 [Pseudoneurospora amorphoporcata]
MEDVGIQSQAGHANGRFQRSKLPSAHVSRPHISVPKPFPEDFIKEAALFFSCLSNLFLTKFGVLKSFPTRPPSRYYRDIEHTMFDFNLLVCAFLLIGHSFLALAAPNGHNKPRNALKTTTATVINADLEVIEVEKTTFNSVQGTKKLKTVTTIYVTVTPPIQPPKSYMVQPPKTYTVQPPKSYTVQPPNSYTVQPPKNYTVQPPKSYTVQPPKSYTVQPPKSYTVQPPKSYTVQPPKSYTVQPPKSYTVQPSKTPTVQPPTYTVQPPTYTVQPPKTYTVQPPKTYTVQPSKTPTVQPSKTPTVQHPKTYTVQPPKTVTVQPPKTVTVQPPKTYTVQPSKPPTVQPPKTITVQPSKTPTVVEFPYPWPHPPKIITIEPRKAATVLPPVKTVTVQPTKTVILGASQDVTTTIHTSSTKTPVNFKEDYTTWYHWEHVGGRMHKAKAKREGRDAARRGKIGERGGMLGKRNVENVETAEVLTSFITLTAADHNVVTITSTSHFVPTVTKTIYPHPIVAPPLYNGAVPVPAFAPPAEQQQQAQQPQLVLPGQIPSTRSDTGGIKLQQGNNFPIHMRDMRANFYFNADRPEQLQPRGKYAALVSTLTKYTPSAAPPPPPPTPTPKLQPQPQPQPIQEQQVQPAQQDNTPENVPVAPPAWPPFFGMPDEVRSYWAAAGAAAAAAATTAAPSVTALSKPSNSLVTSLLTLSAGQAGNKEATVLPVLVAPAAAAAAASASGPVVPPPKIQVPVVANDANSPLVAAVTVVPAGSTTAVYPAANTHHHAEHEANTPVAFVTTFVTVDEAVPTPEKGGAFPKFNNNVWETVVRGQEVVVDGQTVEVMAVITGGP